MTTQLTPGAVVRRADPADATAIDAILRERARDDLALPFLTDDMREQLVSTQVDARAQAYDSAYPRADHEVLAVDGGVVGRMVVDRADRSWRLVDIVLAGSARGRGYGTEAIRLVQSQAQAAGAEVTLAARVDGRPRRLYERLGFETVGGDELDVEMRWAPPAATP